MNIFIASDHAGFDLKSSLASALAEIGHTVVDCGSYAYAEQDDYPMFISKAARAVSESEAIFESEEDSFTLVASQDRNRKETRGIVIGGSGTGEAIVANKYPHVRCAICYGGDSASDIVRLSREHNNSNILSLGARFLSEDEALELVLLWLRTEFTGNSRHVRRLHEVELIEKHKDNPLYE